MFCPTIASCIITMQYGVLSVMLDDDICAGYMMLSMGHEMCGDNFLTICGPLRWYGVFSYFLFSFSFSFSFFFFSSFSLFFFFIYFFFFLFSFLSCPHLFCLLILEFFLVLFFGGDMAWTCYMIHSVRHLSPSVDCLPCTLKVRAHQQGVVLFHLLITISLLKNKTKDW